MNAPASLPSVSEPTARFARAAVAPFAALRAELARPAGPLRAAIIAATRQPEPEAVRALLPLARCPAGQAQAA